jgi:phosphoenolpyruvate carboxykinase (GTP)
MSIWALTNPRGERLHFALAMAHGCAAAELRPGESSLAGWSLEKLSGDTCWMRVERDGHLWAVCPEAGVWEHLGRESGLVSGPRVAERADALFTNVALRDDGCVWWEGCEDELNPHEIVEDWRGAAWTERGGFGSAAHPEAHCIAPHRDGAWASKAVRIDAIILCGRQSRSSPLVYEARSWRHGVYMGATLVDEVGGTEHPHHDPMGMLGYCGYNMGDYLSHWLEVGRKLHYPPKFFHINWFRCDADGKRVWRGGPESMRVLKWIAERIDGTKAARLTPVGLTPELDSLDLEGLDITQDGMLQLLTGNHRALLRQAERSLAFLSQFGDTVPPPLLTEHRYLVRHLQESLH